MTRLFKERRHLLIAIVILILSIALIACGTTLINEEKLDMNQQNNAEKKINIEYLYLDLDVCNPCQSTEAVLDQAVAEITPILEECGYNISCNKIHIQNEEQARELKFMSSPTIRINGQDIQPEISEQACDCCSSLAGNTTVDCRVWVFNGKEYWAPPKSMIINAILSRAYSNSKETIDSSQYTGDIPDNIKQFFAGKKALSAGGNNACCSPSTSTDCCPTTNCCP